MNDLVLRSRRVVTRDGERPCAVLVFNGRITAVEPFDATPPARHVVELDDDTVLLPGLVDTHVHVNEPGRTEWEGFASATRAAAAGGVTTIVDMPLNCIPPTTTVDALELKRKAADGQVHVDVGFWGGAVPGNLHELRPMHDAGVMGFKCFLLDSGVEEFPPLSVAELQAVMREISALDALLVVHAEDAATVAEASAGLSPQRQSRRYADFLSSRPHEAEDRAIEAVIAAARSTGCRVHVLHLSSADALPAIARARADGVRISVETCPHYLTLVAEDVPDGATQIKCCPPIRGAANRERLWDALAEGLIDCVVSDHSPCTADLKRSDTGDFAAAWGGISSLQLGLPLVWTQARRRGHGLVDLVRWMAAGPAAQVGLPDRGNIDVGYVADFCVFAPDESFVVDPSALHHKNPVCAYSGSRLDGVVRSTWLRGRLVTGEVPTGELLLRGGG